MVTAMGFSMATSSIRFSFNFNFKFTYQLQLQVDELSMCNVPRVVG